MRTFDLIKMRRRRQKMRTFDFDLILNKLLRRQKMRTFDLIKILRRRSSSNANL